jgi:5-hydroxyisourate hydrolase-like protein (transthyretin family)
MFGLGACLTITGAALAASAPAEGEAGASVSMASASKPAKVRYGKPLQLRGQVSPGTSGQAVTLQRAAGDGSYRSVAQVRTAAGGSYAFSVRPRHTGSYRAVTTAGTSQSRRVTVLARFAGRLTRHVRSGRAVRVRGKLAPGLGRRVVRLQRRAGGRWRTVDRIRTSKTGRFRARWRTSRAGRYSLRVRFGGDSRNGASSKRLKRVYVYRPGHASWYGPGLYGNRTACGQTLTAGIVGVAHKTLPCGTKVRFRYRGRTAVGKVIDRGPFAAGREWDLTAGLKRKLGFGSTGTVWSSR